MFTDTHCHLRMMQSRGVALESFFREFAGGGNAPLLVDIGTECDDLDGRLALKDEAKAACGTDSFLRFTAGIWPGDQAVAARFAQTEELEKRICKTMEEDSGVLVALGECGLDRNHNTGEKGAAFLAAEEELFAMQLELAQKLALPVVVHSRDAFDATHSVMKNAACRSAAIHCFSYGINEARAFLDLGFYISFSGSITFGKGARLDDARSLARYVPKDRLLLETDAPYLAPAPHRGKTNTPLLIEHTYKFVAEACGIGVELLGALVAANAAAFFALPQSR